MAIKMNLSHRDDDDDDDDDSNKEKLFCFCGVGVCNPSRDIILSSFKREIFFFYRGLSAPARWNRGKIVVIFRFSHFFFSIGKITSLRFCLFANFPINYAHWEIRGNSINGHAGCVHLDQIYMTLGHPRRRAREKICRKFQWSQGLSPQLRRLIPRDEKKILHARLIFTRPNLGTTSTTFQLCLRGSSFQSVRIVRMLRVEIRTIMKLWCNKMDFFLRINRVFN